MDSRRVQGLALNAPEFFEDPDFIAWLNDEKTRVMTWHRRGAQPGDWSDTMVLVDPSLCGEGTDSDMPAEIWEQIVQACRDAGLQGQPDHIPVRLINLPDDRR